MYLYVYLALVSSRLFAGCQRRWLVSVVMRVIALLTVAVLGKKVAESGRPGRAELLAKRPHNRLRRLSAELQNVGEASGKPRGSSDLLELFRKILHLQFLEKSRKNWSNLAKNQQHFGKIK